MKDVASGVSPLADPQPLLVQSRSPVVRLAEVTTEAAEDLLTEIDRLGELRDRGTCPTSPASIRREQHLIRNAARRESLSRTSLGLRRRLLRQVGVLADQIVGLEVSPMPGLPT
ncbi:hypothetical protein [Micromonospora saelicesensis]|uniref:hypothetical protein n=1 Tax=Micromonospora saelicesensis TaxID=285676 RepID=UPI0011BEB4B5|nr:hypothetical protein [Micromonospora saelicesensis]